MAKRELTGRILSSGDPGWDVARRGFNKAYDYNGNQPQDVVFCQDTRDVANAVSWARRNKLPFTARCGRHNYQGYSSLAKNGMIIDVNDMETVRVDREEMTAEVGSGLNMLELTELLWDVGVTFPMATGASVGLAGLVLGGGFGVTSRLHGLTCDHLVDVEMVDARAKILHANERENPDLFWALRGGGGNNFGIATGFTFRVRPVGLVAIFNVTWPWEQFDRVVDLWQRWAPTVDDGVTSLLSLKVDRTITMLGQYTAEPEKLSNASQLLAPLLGQTAPSGMSILVVPFVVAARMFFGVDPINPQWAVREHSDEQIFKSTSALARKPFPPEAIRLVRQALESIPTLAEPPSQPSMVQLLSGGGAPSRVPVDATAVFHRQTQFVVQYDGYWTAPQDAEPTRHWVTNLRSALLPYANGAYVNYSDETLTDPLRAYYGTNLERLVEVKRKYDPNNLFRYPQSIPTQL
jgi:FAD/FMN-containing dehydrogenase